MNLNKLVPMQSFENNDDCIEKKLNLKIKDNDWNEIIKGKENELNIKIKDSDWPEMIKGNKPEKLKILNLFLKVCPNKSSLKNENLLKINKGEEMLMYDLNIVTILKKLIELEKFKEILFDKEQIDLMKVFNTRKIDFTTLKVNDLLKNKLYDMKNDEKIFLNGLSYAYKRCLSSTNEIDKKIIQKLHL